MSSGNRLSLLQIKRFADAIRNACQDRAYETRYNQPSTFWFDTDVVYGTLTAISELSDSTDIESVHHDSYLTRALWMSGYFGRISMLRPHLVEFDGKVRRIDAYQVDASDQLESVLARIGVRYVGAGPNNEGRWEIAATTLERAALLYMIFEAAAGDWRVRLRSMKPVLWVGPESGNAQSRLRIAELGGFNDICVRLADIRRESPVQEATLVDAAALCVLAARIREWRLRPTSPLQRFYSHTRDLYELADLDYFAQDLAHSGNERESAPVNPGPAFCTTEYMIVRAVFSQLAVADVSATSKDTRLPVTQVADIAMDDLWLFARKIDSLVSKDDKTQPVEKVLSELDTIRVGRRSGSELLWSLRASAIWESVWRKNQARVVSKIEDVIKGMRAADTSSAATLWSGIAEAASPSKQEGTWSELRLWAQHIEGFGILAQGMHALKSRVLSSQFDHAFAARYDAGLWFYGSATEAVGILDILNRFVRDRQGTEIECSLKLLEAGRPDANISEQLAVCTIAHETGADRLALSLIENISGLQEGSAEACVAHGIKILCIDESSRRSLRLPDFIRAIRRSASRLSDREKADVLLVGATVFWDIVWDAGMDYLSERMLVDNLSWWKDTLETLADVGDDDAKVVAGALLCVHAGVSKSGRAAFDRGVSLIQSGGVTAGRSRRIVCWKNYGDQLVEERERETQQESGGPADIPSWRPFLLLRHWREVVKSRVGLESPFERWYLSRVFEELKRSPSPFFKDEIYKR